MKTIFITLLLSSFTFAQQKIPPPPTKIALPSDTMRTALKQPGKIEADGSQMELPDVVVLGQDRTLRIADSKQTSTREGPRLIQPETAYQVLSIWNRREDEKATTKSTKAAEQMTWVEISGGGYRTLSALAGHRRPINDGQVQGYVWLERSNGTHANSRYSQGGLASKLDYRLSPEAIGTVRLEYAWYGRGLHRALLFPDSTSNGSTDSKRNARNGKLAVDLRYNLNDRSKANLGIDIDGVSVRSDTASKQFDHAGDLNYRLKMAYTADISRVQVSATAQYMRESFDRNADSTNNIASLGEIGVESIFPISKVVSAQVNLYYQSFSADSANKISSVSPTVTINYLPSPQFGLGAELYRGLSYKTYSDWWRHNPYIGQRHPMQAEERKFGYRLNCETLFTPRIQIAFSFRREYLKTLLYWERNKSSKLIDLNAIADPKTSELQLRVRAWLTNHLLLRTSLTSYSDRIKTAGTDVLLDQIPYRPDYHLSISAMLKFYQDLDFTVQAEIWGERRSALEQSGRLPAFVRINARMEKNFGQFAAYLAAQNLTDSEYDYWENYPEMKVHLLLGVKAKF